LFLVLFLVSVARSLSLQSHVNRRVFFRSTALILPLPPALAGVNDIFEAAIRENDKTYSQNGKNIQRMQRGDFSMGAKQTSSSEKGLKRRAALACKSPKALKEVEIYPDEAACARDVLNGRIEPMLNALHRLGDSCKVDATHVCL